MIATLEIERDRLQLEMNRAYNENPIRFQAQRRAETWLCPQCNRGNVHHTSHGDGIICRYASCGFAPYPWNYGPGRTAPAIRRFL